MSCFLAKTLASIRTLPHLSLPGKSLAARGGQLERQKKRTEEDKVKTARSCPHVDNFAVLWFLFCCKFQELRELFGRVLDDAPQL